MNRKVENFKKAVDVLARALALPIAEERDLAGVIKSFECAYELSWTTLKAYLRTQGHEPQGARDVFRMAWQLGILNVGQEKDWLKMIAERNLTVHTYDRRFAEQMVRTIRDLYFPVLDALAFTAANWAWE